MQEQRNVFLTPPQSEYVDPLPSEALSEAEHPVARSRRLTADSRLLIDQAQRLIAVSKELLTEARAQDSPSTQ